MPHEQPVGGTGIRALLVFGVLMLAVVVIAGACVLGPPPATEPATAMTEVSTSPATQAVTFTPSAAPSATAQSPRPTAHASSGQVLTTSEFAKAFVSGQYVGYTVLVEGRIDSTPEVPGDYISDGLLCDGERACPYGQLAGAEIDGGTKPLVVWSRLIATPLGPDDRPDEYYWPSNAREPLPVEGVLVLRIDTTYSAEYLGRALVGDGGPIWAPESVVEMSLGDLALSEVVLVDGWLAGQVGSDCPAADFEPPLPSNTCGDPSWIHEGADLIPVQNDAYGQFALRPPLQATGSYAPQHGLWLIGSRLAQGGSCGQPACPGWHVLDHSLFEFVDLTPIANQPLPGPVPDTGWVELEGDITGAIAWSPDGRWLLVTDRLEIRLVDAASGSTARRWDFDSGRFSRGAVWIDDHRFLAFGQPPPFGSVVDGLAPGVIGRVDSARLTETRVPIGREDGTPFVASVAGGVAAVAFATTDDSLAGCERNGCWRFRVWTPDGITDERPGLPIAWSPAGDRLAVIHDQGDRARTGSDLAVGAGFGGYAGWLEVLSWPGWKTVLADRHVIAHEDSAFDPSGERLATAVWPPAWIDLAKGRVHQPEQPGVVFGQVWGTNGLLFGTDSDGNVLALDANGDVSGRWYGAGQEIIGAADGSRQVARLRDEVRGAPFGWFTVIAIDSPPVTFALSPLSPDSFLFESSISPDGRAMVVTMSEYSSGHDRVLLHQLP